jgi:lysophospholipase L1-like esterase
LSVMNKLVSLARDSWNIIGLTLLLVLGLEFFLGLFLPSPGERLVASWRNMADAEANVPNTEWARKHLNEIRQNWLWLEWAPFVHWRMKPLQGETLTIAEDGFRPTRSFSSKDKPTLTLHMYGASTMVGWGAGDDETIPAVLSELLSEDGHNVVVKNYGQWSYVAKQEALLFSLDVAQGNKPDIAVFYDGCNELIGPPQDLALGPIFSTRAQKEHAILSYERRHDLVKQYLLNAARWSSLIQLVTPDRAWEPPETFIEEQSNRIDREYSQSVNLSQSVADANNIKTLYFWQPIAYHKQHLTENEKGVLDLAEDAERGGSLNFWRKYMASVDQKLNERFANKQNFHDISGTYDDSSESLFMDLCHTNPAGYRMVAEEMLPYITAMIEDHRRKRSYPML